MCDKTIESFARENYVIKFHSKEQFKRDFRILFSIRKMIRRFIKTGDINIRLLINHIIILTNVFGITPTNILLDNVFIDNKEGWAAIKSVLIFLDRFNLDGDFSNPCPVMKMELKLMEEIRQFNSKKEDHYQ